MNETFVGAWKLSFSKTHRQLPVLLKVCLALGVYFLRDFLLLAALLAAGILLRGPWNYIFGSLSVLEFLWILIKLNGAIGMATTLIAVGRSGACEIGGEAYRKSAKFFWNGLQTGVILFFGQVLLVCPCFLLLNNFLFSPYLIVYEGVGGTAAKRRSKELAAGAPWIILNRTAVLMLAGYAFLLVVAALLLTKFFLVAAILIFFSGIYLAQVQSNYIRLVYEQAVQLHDTGTSYDPQGQFKILTAVTVFLLIAVYIGIKLSPHFLNKTK